VALAAILPGPLCELGFTANRDGVTLAEPDQLLGELAKPDYRGEKLIGPNGCGCVRLAAGPDALRRVAG